jgi:hypothetical protein
MNLKGNRKHLIGMILLINTNIIYFTSSAPNKLDLMINFLIFLGGILVAGNVGEHYTEVKK